MVAREGDELALSELGQRVGLEVACTKDGSVFDKDLDAFDCIAFYTSSGDLTPANKHNEPPMTSEGKQRMLEAIAASKPFVGIYAAAGIWHPSKNKWRKLPACDAAIGRSWKLTPRPGCRPQAGSPTVYGWGVSSHARLKR
jgi:hypothetical protein